MPFHRHSAGRWGCIACNLLVSILIGRAQQSNGGGSSPDRDLAPVASVPVDAVVTREQPTAESIRRTAVTGSPTQAAAAARAWDSLRWISPATGEAMDVSALLGSFADSRIRGAWESFIARYGADAVYAVAAMRQTAGQQENAIRAFALLLSAVSAVDIARSVASPGAAAARESFRELLIGAADRVPDPPGLIRMCEILLLLWWYEDLPDVAARAFGASQNDAFVSLAASGVRRSGMETVPADALRRLVGSRPRPERDAETVFWIRVARETGLAETIRGILPAADVLRMKPADAGVLAETLASANEMSEVDRLFADAATPSMLYLRSRFGPSPDGVAGVSAGVSRSIDALDPQSTGFSTDAFDLGELMERYGDAGPAERVWRLLIQRTEGPTVHSANARLRLARRAEARGDLAGALQLCEEALAISRDLGADAVVTGPGGGRGTEWLMRVVLDLKRKIGEQSPPMP